MQSSFRLTDVGRHLFSAPFFVFIFAAVVVENAKDTIEVPARFGILSYLLWCTWWWRVC